MPDGLADPGCCGDTEVAEARPGVMYCRLSGVQNDTRCQDCDDFNDHTFSLYLEPEHPFGCVWAICSVQDGCFGPGIRECSECDSAIPCDDPDRGSTVFTLSITFVERDGQCWVVYSIEIYEEDSFYGEVAFDEWKEKGFAYQMEIHNPPTSSNPYNTQHCDWTNGVTCRLWGPA